MNHETEHKTTSAMRCGQCGHIYRGHGDPYTCPACNAGPPHTHTVYLYADKHGNPIHPTCLSRLRQLGIVDNTPTRDEFLAAIPVPTLGAEQARKFAHETVPTDKDAA